MDLEGIMLRKASPRKTNTIMKSKRKKKKKNTKEQSQLTEADSQIPKANWWSPAVPGVA